MELLPKEQLLQTGPVDHADWNYRPVLGGIQRLRFSLALSLLPPQSDRILEVGFGSGVFMPSLRRIARQLYGIDVHNNVARVRMALASRGLDAELVRSPAEALPFKTGCFDTVVAVSSLEFVTTLSAACCEVRRVLRTGGLFVVVTPGHSALVDAGLRILTGNRARQDFSDRREKIIPTLLNYFNVDKRRTAPPMGGNVISLYHAFRLTSPDCGREIG